MSTYWPVVIAMGVGTFLFRLSFILLVDKLTFPETVTRMLRFIPVSVLPALIVPSVLFTGGNALHFAGWDHVLAALTAVIVSWKTGNVFLTILSGMGVLWILQAAL